MRLAREGHRKRTNEPNEYETKFSIKGRGLGGRFVKGSRPSLKNVWQVIQLKRTRTPEGKGSRKAERKKMQRRAPRSWETEARHEVEGGVEKGRSRKRRTSRMGPCAAVLEGLNKEKKN